MSVVNNKSAVTAYIGLGSNLFDPVAQIQTACRELGQIPESHLLACSDLYRSPPMGPADQPDYINAVAAISTTLLPHQLLTELQRIEHSHGRIRKQRWGARTLDLDLLIFADQTILDETLTVPHPGLARRAFVLYPLQEIAPSLVVPGLGSVAKMVADCPLDGLTRYE